MPPRCVPPTRRTVYAEQMDDDGLKKVIKYYPHTRQADLAPLT